MTCCHFVFDKLFVLLNRVFMSKVTYQLDIQVHSMFVLSCYLLAVLSLYSYYIVRYKHCSLNIHLDSYMEMCSHHQRCNLKEVRKRMILLTNHTNLYGKAGNLGLPSYTIMHTQKSKTLMKRLITWLYNLFHKSQTDQSVGVQV